MRYIILILWEYLTGIYIYIVWKPPKSKVDAEKFDTWEISRKNIIDQPSWNRFFQSFGVCFDTSHWFGGSGSELSVSIFNMKWGTKELRVSAWQLKKCKWYISWGDLMWYFMRYNQQWAFSPWELIWPPKWGYTFLINDGWLQRLMVTSWFYFFGRANEAIQEFWISKWGIHPPVMAIQVEKMMIHDWYNTLFTVHVPFFAQTHVLNLVNLAWRSVRRTICQWPRPLSFSFLNGAPAAWV